LKATSGSWESNLYIRENQFGNNCDEKLGKTVLTGEIGHRFAEWSLIGIKI